MITASNYINHLRTEGDIFRNTQKIMEECEKINSEYKYFNCISKDMALEQAEELAEYQNPRKRKSSLKNKESDASRTEKKLFGLSVSVKDCLCVKGIESRAGSKILSGYKPLFNATAVERLIDAGAVVIGKTSQDEFGFGSFNINMGKGFEVPLNPLDIRRVCGGSSGGGAGITRKLSYPHLAVVESTGGSISCPAAFCGVAGITPTYGQVSRYGIIDYASSLDKIGLMSKEVSTLATGLGVIAGRDEKDSTSSEREVDDYESYIKKDVKKLKIGIISDTIGEGSAEYVREAIANAVSKLESFGVQSQKISLPMTSKYGLPTYYIISTAEASTNLAKYCGLRYGAQTQIMPQQNYNEYFTKVRTDNLGREAKRRIILGTYVRMAGYRDHYYLHAMKVRTKIIEEYKRQFKHFDLLLSPTMPLIAPKMKEAEELTPIQNYMMDIMTVGPNLAGLPHMSVTAGYEKGMPIGMQLIGNHFDEKKVLQAGNVVHNP